MESTMHFGKMIETGNGWTKAGLQAGCSCGWISEHNHPVTSIDVSYDADYAAYLKAHNKAVNDFRAHVGR
jgi:hypothetical protein